MVVAIVLIQAEAARIAELGPTLAGVDGVAEVYSVTGDEDLVAILRVNDNEQVAAIVTEHLSSMSGVISTRTLIAFRQYDPDVVDF